MDTSIDGDLGGVYGRVAAVTEFVSLSPGVVYWIYNAFGATADTDNIVYRKFSGGSWGSRVNIRNANNQSVSLWHDEWTKGITGDKVHMIFGDEDVDDLIYDALDLSDDTLDGAVSVYASPGEITGGGARDSVHIEIVRAVGGNLYAYFNIDGIFQFYRSVDNGANWTSRDTTGMGELTADRAKLVPGNEADGNDVYLLFYDESAGEFTIKTYDDTDNSWSESAALLTGLSTNIFANTIPFDAVQRHSDGHILVGLQNSNDAATGDLKFIDITNNTTWSVLGDVITDADDFMDPRIFINQQDDSVRVSYIGKGDGSQTIFSTVSVNTKLSVDGGLNWGSETAYMVDAPDDIRAITSTAMVGLLGGNFMLGWFNDDLTEYFTNLDNTIEISAGFSAALTGTTADGATELEMEAGGETTIITLTSDTWAADGVAFEAVRQAIIDGCSATTTPATGWNNEVRDNEAVGSVVRTSDTIVTITWTAAPNYTIASTETITVTVPVSALVSSSDPLVATPTFDVEPSPPPTITDLDPSSGLSSGGTAVTITGTNFTGTTGVTFDGAPATSVVVVSPTEVTCVSPVHVAGTIRVILTTGNGSSSDVSADDYTYFDPTLSVEDDIRTHIEAQLTGEPTIFVQGLPAAPDNAIGIVMLGGPPPAMAMGPTVVERMFSFSVYVRSARGQGEATETLAQAVHAVLRAQKDVVINSTTYDKIVTIAIPQREDEDSNGRPVQVATYTIWRAGA